MSEPRSSITALVYVPSQHPETAPKAAAIKKVPLVDTTKHQLMLMAEYANENSTIHFLGTVSTKLSSGDNEPR